jgi:hypothetical protein
LQFQLIEQALAALRARAVYLALHLRDHRSKVLDQGFRTEHLRAHLDERRLQRVIVFRKVIVVGKFIFLGKVVIFGKIMIRHRHDANRPQSPLIRSSHVVISTINSNLLTCVDINRAISFSPPQTAASYERDCASRFLPAGTEVRGRDHHRATSCIQGKLPRVKTSVRMRNSKPEQLLCIAVCDQCTVRW